MRLCPSRLTNSTGPYQPGSKVTNRIKLNYGLTLNNLFGLNEPVNTLFPGRVYVGQSLASPSETAMIVDYSDPTTSSPVP